MIHTHPSYRSTRPYKWLLTTVVLLLAVLLAAPAATQSEPPGREPVQAAQLATTTYFISFQGRLLSPGTGVPKPDATYPVVFRIYTTANAPASNAVWSESKNVSTVRGVFSTMLGDTAALQPSIFNGQDLWLGMAVNGEELAPRQQFAYTPYALYAPSAGNAATLAGSAASAFAAAGHTHDGGAIVSGAVSESRIDPAVARDNEVVTLISHSGAFAPAGHGHLGETWTGSAPLLLNTTNTAALVAASSASDGFQISSAADDGIQVNQANYGLYVINAANTGILIANTGNNGISINTSAGEGLVIGTVAKDGVKIYTVGSPTGSGINSVLQNGIEIENTEGNGLFVGHSNGDGVHVESGGYNGGYFKTEANNGNGVLGIANNGSNAFGVFGASANGYAGFFDGKVNIAGTLTKSSGAFKIDHPLDPANKVLYHSFVESPDMKNIYDGVVTLDANGQATVLLPAWFEALNRDFRYQLTCIGGYAPVYIAVEVNNNQFTIAGGSPGLKVSWQVTGIRHDPYAESNRIAVEEMKPPAEQGTYLFPAGYGQAQALSAANRLKAAPDQPVTIQSAGAGAQTGVKTENR